MLILFGATHIYSIVEIREHLLVAETRIAGHLEVRGVRSRHRHGKNNTYICDWDELQKKNTIVRYRWSECGGAGGEVDAAASFIL